MKRNISERRATRVAVGLARSSDRPLLTPGRLNDGCRAILQLCFGFRCSMKQRLSQYFLAGAAVITSVAILGCGRQKSTTPEAVPAAAKPEATPPPIPSAGGSVTKLDGYWVPDKDRMLQIYQEAIAAKTGSAAIDPAALANAAQIVEGVLALMFVQIENGKSRVYSPKGTEESDFEVLSSDESTGEYTVESRSIRGGVTTSVCKLEGNLLTLAVGSNSLVLRRIDRAEFDERKQAIEGSATGAASPTISASPPPSAPPVGEAP